MFRNKVKTAAQDAGVTWIYILILAGPWIVWAFVDSLLWARTSRAVAADVNATWARAHRG